MRQMLHRNLQRRYKMLSITDESFKENSRSLMTVLYGSSIKVVVLSVNSQDRDVGVYSFREL